MDLIIQLCNLAGLSDIDSSALTSHSLNSTTTMGCTVIRAIADTFAESDESLDMSLTFSNPRDYLIETTHVLIVDDDGKRIESAAMPILVVPRDHLSSSTTQSCMN